jgi:hypothetical protein
VFVEAFDGFYDALAVGGIIGAEELEVNIGHPLD